MQQPTVQQPRAGIEGRKYGGTAKITHLLGFPRAIHGLHSQIMEVAELMACDGSVGIRVDNTSILLVRMGVRKGRGIAVLI